MKIGVLGGTFDPVHRGHIMMAEEARDALGLDEVIMLPAGVPMSRPGEKLTPAADRLAMLRLAVAGRPRLSVSTMELERSGPSFTVDSITELRNYYDKNDEIYFILGWDSLEQVRDWWEPERLISLCRLAAVPRPGYPRPETAALDKGVAGLSGRVDFLARPRVDISASAVREKAAGGESIGELVPDPVARYIREHGLYSGGKS